MKHHFAWLCRFSALLFAFALQGCNGTSGENGDDPFGNGTVTPPASPTITLQVLDGSCTNLTNRTNLGDNLCLQASVAQDGVALANEIVEFSSTMGSLSVTSSLTNAQGIAHATLISAESNLGAGQITVTSTINALTVSASSNIEILAATPVPDNSASIAIRIDDVHGNPVNRISVNGTLVANAMLMDANNQPLVDTIVNFQTSIGTMTPAAVLTNAQGVASTTFVPDDRIGAGTIMGTVTLDGELIAASQNFEVLPADAVDEDIVRIGAFENGSFVEGALGLDGFELTEDVSLSAGGTLGLTVALVDSADQPVSLSLPVSFSTACQTAGNAKIDQTVIAANGIARSTYRDLSCAGANGNNDVITASINVNGQQTTVSRVLSIQPEAAGSVKFVSAEPSNIVLSGTGGQNTDSVSTVTFQVDSALGNPLAQQQVTFSLNTEIGDLSLSPVQALTNSDGQVSTRVTAGSVPTSVRVTASTQGDGGVVLKSQSDLLSVNTGLPDQNSFTIAANNLNPEAFGINGQEVMITARLADSFNNPVPDGTAVSFIAEGGVIQPSCTTTNGACSVIWTSSAPSVSDHRLTILATAVGHESLYDSNGNNQYETEDGPAIILESGSGLDTSSPTQTGFSDLPEAWLDENENGILDNAEVFLDFNNSGSFDSANGLFDGPQCSSDCAASSSHVRSALVLVTASSAALISLSDSTQELANNSTLPSLDPVASIARNSNLGFRISFSDTAGQPIPSGSTIEISASSGTLTGQLSTVMPSTNNAAERVLTVNLINDITPLGESVQSALTVEITTPSGVSSSLLAFVTLE